MLISNCGRINGNERTSTTIGLNCDRPMRISTTGSSIRRGSTSTQQTNAASADIASSNFGLLKTKRNQRGLPRIDEMLLHCDWRRQRLRQLRARSPPSNNRREWRRRSTRGRRTSDAMVDAAGERQEVGGEGMVLMLMTW